MWPRGQATFPDLPYSSVGPILGLLLEKCVMHANCPSLAFKEIPLCWLEMVTPGDSPEDTGRTLLAWKLADIGKSAHLTTPGHCFCCLSVATVYPPPLMNTAGEGLMSFKVRMDPVGS